jgi:hypothetical protein
VQRVSSDGYNMSYGTCGARGFAPDRCSLVLQNSFLVLRVDIRCTCPRCYDVRCRSDKFPMRHNKYSQPQQQIPEPALRAVGTATPAAGLLTTTCGSLC